MGKAKIEKKTLILGILTMVALGLIGFGLTKIMDQISRHTTIDQVAAENFAYSDAGFQSNDVLLLDNTFTKEQGAYVYKISFVKDTTQYDYTVRAADGKVLGKNQSVSAVSYTSEKQTPKPEKEINVDVEQAKQIARDYFDIEESQSVFYTKAKLDDETHMKYAIEFTSGNQNYSAEIAASNGEVLFHQVQEIESATNVAATTNTPHIQTPTATPQPVTVTPAPTPTPIPTPVPTPQPQQPVVVPVPQPTPVPNYEPVYQEPTDYDDPDDDWDDTTTYDEPDDEDDSSDDTDDDDSDDDDD